MNIRSQLIIAELDRHRVQFEHLCRSFTAGELATKIPRSHWSVKDYVAHLATIDALIASNFGAMVGVQAPPPVVPVPQPFDIDDWNDLAVEARKDKSLEELLTEAASHRANLVAAIERMSDAQLDMVISYGGDRKTLGLAPTPVRFGGLLWAIAIHDPTHAQDMLEALPGRAGEAWLGEWLGSVNDGLVPAGVKEQRV